MCISDCSIVLANKVLIVKLNSKQKQFLEDVVRI